MISILTDLTHFVTHFRYTSSLLTGSAYLIYKSFSTSFKECWLNPKR